jgi:pyruvate dehydrogenase E2 component (dihydrolipoyllysine-residue acetyltransferase)
VVDDQQDRVAERGAPTSARGRSERLPLDRRAQAGARRAAESKATIPHLYASRVVETGELGPDELVATVVAALGRALRESPALNSSYRDGALEVHSRINVGLTIETPDGSLLPTLFDADKRSVIELKTEISNLRARAAAGEITSPELAGGTFAVSTAGHGADSIVPTVIPGQAGHLGIGRPRQAAVISDGLPSAAAVTELTISCDQRAAGPATAGALLESIAGWLATPERLAA